MVIRSNQWKKSQSAKATWASLARIQAERSKRTDRSGADQITEENDADALPSRIRVREFLSSLLPEEPQPLSDRFEVERRPRMSWRVLRRR